MQQPGPEEAVEPELASAAAAAPLPPPLGPVPLERNERAVAREITPPPAPPPAEELHVIQFQCSASTPHFALGILRKVRLILPN